jgi:hypothetical protein
MLFDGEERRKELSQERAWFCCFWIISIYSTFSEKHKR